MRTAQVIVAGTAGGVGTTTVTALLFDAMSRLRHRAPQLADHTAGTLGARLPDGDEVPAVDAERTVADLGPLALTVGADRLVDPEVGLVLVSAATPVGCALAGRGLDAADRQGEQALGRTVVVLNEVFGRSRVRDSVRELAGRGPAAVVLLGRDAALAAGGRIPRSRLSRDTHRAVERLVAVLELPARTVPAAGATSAADPSTRPKSPENPPENSPENPPEKIAPGDTDG